MTSRTDKVIGTHFFVPAYYMRLLENVRGEKTSAETIATAMALGSKIGKVSDNRDVMLSSNSEKKSVIRGILNVCETGAQH